MSSCPTQDDQDPRVSQWARLLESAASRWVAHRKEVGITQVRSINQPLWCAPDRDLTYVLPILFRYVFTDYDKQEGYASLAGFSRAPHAEVTKAAAGLSKLFHFLASKPLKGVSFEEAVKESGLFEVDSDAMMVICADLVVKLLAWYFYFVQEAEAQGELAKIMEGNHG